jgi:hypothetical protein
MEGKKKNKNKTTESVGNTIEEGQENGGRWREMRNQKMTICVMMMMMMMMMMRRRRRRSRRRMVMIRKKSNKQEKEKNSKGIIRQIDKCNVQFTL